MEPQAILRLSKFHLRLTLHPGRQEPHIGHSPADWQPEVNADRVDGDGRFLLCFLVAVVVDEVEDNPAAIRLPVSVDLNGRRSIELREWLRCVAPPTRRFPMRGKILLRPLADTTEDGINGSQRLWT